MTSRKINWVSSIDIENQQVLDDLEKKLHNFYKNKSNYYSKISFTENVWNDKDALIQQDLINQCSDKNKILEVGCGQAFILQTGKIDPSRYTGVDFSEFLIKKNKEDFPDSTFLTIEKPNQLPFDENSFDLVFSHFVLEHNVFPKPFLNERNRVLKCGGVLIIVAPDFLGNLSITSQKSGLSKGTGREKLKAGKYLDAIVTAFDNKIRIPVVALTYRFAAYLKPRFYINLTPTCFEYDFSPDLDAVYLTYEREIKHYLRNKLKFFDLKPALASYIKNNKLIYIIAVKSNN